MDGTGTRSEVDGLYQRAQTRETTLLAKLADLSDAEWDELTHRMMKHTQRALEEQGRVIVDAAAVSLDEAWREAEAALTARADWWRIRSLTEIAFAPMRWEVVATDGNRIVKAEGHDPAAALQALAARLRGSR